MVAATVITYTDEAPSGKDAARHLAGPLIPTLAKLWTDTHGTLPSTYYLLVHEEGASDHQGSGPVRRLNPAAFAKGTGAVPVVCTMTDDPEAASSKYCVWQLGLGG